MGSREWGGGLGGGLVQSFVALLGTAAGLDSRVRFSLVAYEAFSTEAQGGQKGVCLARNWVAVVVGTGRTI